MTIILKPGSVPLETLEKIYREGLPVRIDPAFHAGVEKAAARIAEIASSIPETGRSKERKGVKGALAMAREGYKELFDKWLPELRTNGPLPTLMLIMATLDDTNILHRGGSEALAYVKARATEIYENGRIGIENEIREFGRELKDRNLSPGGAADMLALTMLAAKIEK